MDVSKNRGKTTKMDGLFHDPTKRDDLGVPLFLETPISNFPTQEMLLAFANVWESPTTYLASAQPQPFATLCSSFM